MKERVDVASKLAAFVCEFLHLVHFLGFFYDEVCASKLMGSEGCMPQSEQVGFVLIKLICVVSSQQKGDHCVHFGEWVAFEFDGDDVVVGLE